MTRNYAARVFHLPNLFNDDSTRSPSSPVTAKKTLPKSPCATRRRVFVPSTPYQSGRRRPKKRPFPRFARTYLRSEFVFSKARPPKYAPTSVAHVAKSHKESPLFTRGPTRRSESARTGAIYITPARLNIALIALFDFTILPKERLRLRSETSHKERRGKET
jgi:hypothetical protein